MADVFVSIYIPLDYWYIPPFDIFDIFLSQSLLESDIISLMHALEAETENSYVNVLQKLVDKAF